MNPIPLKANRSDGDDSYDKAVVSFSITLRDGKSKLTLEETQFEKHPSEGANHPSTAIATIIGMTVEPGRQKDRSIFYFKFARSAGVRAIQRLFLNSFSQFPDPSTAPPLEGVPAATLYESINPNTSKTQKPSWLMSMFLVEAHDNHAIPGQPLHLSQLLQLYFFKASKDRQTGFGMANLKPVWLFRPKLPHPFKAVIVNEHNQPAHPATYHLLSDIIGACSSIGLFFQNKKLAAGIRKSKQNLTRLEERRLIGYLVDLYTEARLVKDRAEIEAMVGDCITGSLDRLPIVYVILDPEQALLLFQAALRLPMPSLEDNIITLFHVENPNISPPTARLECTNPGPPENASSLTDTLAKWQEIRTTLENLPPSKARADFEKEVDQMHARLASRLKPNRASIREGSTVLEVRLSPENSQRLEQALIEGHTELPDEIMLTWEPDRPVSWLEKYASVEINPVEASPSIQRKLLQKAYHREFLLRPWRRLYSLLWLQPHFSPSASVLGASAARAYGYGNARSQSQSLLADLKMGWLAWPILTCLLIVLSCLIAGLFGQTTNIGWGLATGLILSLIGAQPCSYVVSPLACHAGAIFVGWAFGFSGALLMGSPDIAHQIGGSAILADPFKTITGGLMGLSAPYWRPLDSASHGLSLTIIYVMLAFTAAGIGISGWLMGQAKSAQTTLRPKGRLPDWAGAGLGFFAGGAIKGVQGLSQALEKYYHLDPDKAFGYAFALVGGIVMTAMIAWRTKDSPGVLLRSAAAGLIHAAIAFSLTEATFTAASHSYTLISACLVCATCGYYHSTWFSAAYVIGEAVSTTRGAVFAAMLEGIPFYLAYLISTMLHKPLF